MNIYWMFCGWNQNLIQFVPFSFHDIFKKWALSILFYRERERGKMSSLNLGQQMAELGIELGAVWCQMPVHSWFLIFITLLLKDWFWEFLSTNAIGTWNHRQPWLNVLETYLMHVGWSIFLFFSMHFLIFSLPLKIYFFLWLLFCYVWMKRTYRQKKKKS